MAFFYFKKKGGLKVKDWIRHRSSSKDFFLHLFFLYQLLHLLPLLHHIRTLRIVILILLSLNPLSTPLPRPVPSSTQALVWIPTPFQELPSMPKLPSTSISTATPVPKLIPIPNQKKTKTIYWNTTSLYLMLLLMIWEEKYRIWWWECVDLEFPVVARVWTRRKTARSRLFLKQKRMWRLMADWPKPKLNHRYRYRHPRLYLRQRCQCQQMMFYLTCSGMLFLM